MRALACLQSSSRKLSRLLRRAVQRFFGRNQYLLKIPDPFCFLQIVDCRCPKKPLLLFDVLFNQSQNRAIHFSVAKLSIVARSSFRLFSARGSKVGRVACTGPIPISNVSVLAITDRFVRRLSPIYALRQAKKYVIMRDVSAIHFFDPMNSC